MLKFFIFFYSFRNDDSILSMSSQPMPVPNTSHRSITDEHYSRTDSTVSDNIVAQPSSSHKSNYR